MSATNGTTWLQAQDDVPAKSSVLNWCSGMSESSISYHEMSTQECVNEELGTAYELSPLIKQPRLKICICTLQRGTPGCAVRTYVLCDQ